MAPLTRRYFLKSAGLSLFGAGFVPSFMRRTAFALEQPGRSTRKKILVAVFQRGAADGLNIVVPFGERDYYSLRPSISIPEPPEFPQEEEAARLPSTWTASSGSTPALPRSNRFLTLATWPLSMPQDRRTARAPTLMRRTTWSRRRLD